MLLIILTTSKQLIIKRIFLRKIVTFLAHRNTCLDNCPLMAKIFAPHTFPKASFILSEHRFFNKCRANYSLNPLKFRIFVV